MGFGGDKEAFVRKEWGETTRWSRRKVNSMQEREGIELRPYRTSQRPLSGDQVGRGEGPCKERSYLLLNSAGAKEVASEVEEAQNGTLGLRPPNEEPRASFQS